VVLKSIFAALLNYSTTLKMEAIRSSETSGTTQRTTRRHIPEEDTLQLYVYLTRVSKELFCSEDGSRRFLTKRVGVSLTLLTCTWEVFGSNLRWDMAVFIMAFR
jgi:hypothetical protein